MFVDACEIARGFTRPVIISRRQLDGSVKSVCGTFIVLNKDGWVMTAAHVFNSFVAFQKHEPLVKEYRAKVAAIRGDSSLDAKQKAKRIKRIKSDPKWIVNHSFWWGRDGVTMPRGRVQGEIDVAVGRLEPWDPAWASSYPTIKDPDKDMQPGRSLCRLGFPFSDIASKFDESKDGFVLDKSATPFFPLEGIYTRNVDLGRTTDDKYDKMLLETSSPGLMGQSGGPIFDVQGTVWALQSRTHHYDLGFSPKTKKGKEEHQFLNVGWAVHAKTIVAFLRDNGIDFQLSDY
jgi:hypothetical protein